MGAESALGRLEGEKNPSSTFGTLGLDGGISITGNLGTPAAELELAL